MKNRIVGAWLLGLSAIFVAPAQTLEDEFARGNEWYRQGNFREAVQRYESIVRQGVVSVPLLFNLGNAYYRLGDIQRAILAYERALRLDPGDDDVQFNLKLARMRAVDRIDPVPELFLISWLKAAAGALPLKAATALFAVSWAILFLSLTTMQIIDADRPKLVLRWAVIVLFVIALGSGLALGLHISQLAEENEAIIVAMTVTAKTSPDEQSLDAFVIHGGLKVRVDDTVGEWAKITLPDGKVGWVLSSSFEWI